MGFSRAIDPVNVAASLSTSFVLRAGTLVLTTGSSVAAENARLAQPPAIEGASSQTMMNQSLTAQAAALVSPALSLSLVNAGDRAPEANNLAEEPQAEDPQDYAASHWRRHESEAEHAFRVMRAEEEAQALFARATIPQKQAYDAVMADLRGLSAPRYDRRRAAALRVWRDATQDARLLYFRTCDALMREGEMSDDLDRAWTRLIDPARAKALWSDA